MPLPLDEHDRSLVRPLRWRSPSWLTPLLIGFLGAILGGLLLLGGLHVYQDHQTFHALVNAVVQSQQQQIQQAQQKPAVPQTPEKKP